MSSMLELFTLQKELSAIAAVSGREKPQREYIKEKVAPLVEEITIDAMGNLICHRSSHKVGAKKLMLAAHMDVIGFYVRSIDEEGYIWIDDAGGIWHGALIDKPVRFPNGVKGTIREACFGSAAGKTLHNMNCNDICVDIGAEHGEEARTMVSVGDWVCFDTPTEQLLNERIMTPYADDLVACGALMILLEKLKEKELGMDLTVVFTTQEEVGLKGARTSAFGVQPDYAIAVDVTQVDDAPYCNKILGEVAMDGGPVLRERSAGEICDRIFNDQLEAAAKSCGIQVQRPATRRGGTDAGAMQLAGAGVTVASVGIPTRHIHYTDEIYSMKDVNEIVCLLTKLLEEGLPEVAR